ncbi:flavin reductase [Candidatus Fermentibacterales bacterium]|nr:flavin reductase [Candidatus Fermentibacterales bacterium]
MDKRALHRISYGVYIVCARLGERLNGQICNTVFQITSEPPVVAISINRGNFTHDCLCDLGAFSVSVLSTEAPLRFIGRFGFRCGRDFEKLTGDVSYRMGRTGAPIVLDYCVAWLECSVVGRTDLGTHTLFMGEVVDCEIVDDKTPMTYEYYHNVVKGKSPERAPTYIGQS